MKNMKNRKADVNYFALGVAGAVILLIILLYFGIGPISVRMANLGKAIGGAFT
ncbi:hypothetical protein HYX08_03960 [Candidatus Woesearchaeota archaeon]|nr:hypothetical protein [Candidatus Woesearchaeota archaeon]